MMAQQWAVIVGSAAIMPSQASSSTDPSQFLYQLGAFGVAVVVAWWLLGRGDKQIVAERLENAKEVVRMQELLEHEQKAHQDTRNRLYQALENKNP